MRTPLYSLKIIKIWMLLLLLLFNCCNNNAELKEGGVNRGISGITPKKVLKSKLIFMTDFNGEWPFVLNSVSVEQWDENSAIVIIEGIPYALNGIAKSKFKLNNAHDLGKAIKGKSIGPFIKIALELK